MQSFLGLPPLKQWELIRRVQSKAFPVEQGWGLPNSKLIHNKEELLRWTNLHEGNKVLKTCYSYSGVGHYHFLNHEDLQKPRVQNFLQKQWNIQLPLVAQTWLEATRLFSVHWYFSITSAICLGETELYCSSKGRFSGISTCRLKEENLCKPYIENLSKLKFTGNLSFDFLQTEDSVYLCEINARKTFGWLACELQKRHFSNKTLFLRFSKNKERGLPLLPQKLDSGVHCPFQLFLSSKVAS